MRHQRAGNHLSRTTAHRDAMVRNMAASLIRHERITTTVPKARNLRPFVEKLVTLAKESTQHRRRLAFSRLRDKEATAKLFDVLGPRFKARAGGYTRILKLQKRRLGDGGEQSIIEFVERTVVEAASGAAPDNSTGAAKPAEAAPKAAKKPSKV